MKKVNVKDLSDSSKKELEAYALKKMEEIKEDKDISIFINTLKLSEDVVKDNLSKFIDFMNDNNYCKNCPGLDKCNKDSPHLTLTLNIDEGIVERIYSPCHLMKERMVRDSYFVYQDFDPDFENVTPYELKDITNPSNKRFEMLKSFNKIIDGKSNKSGLYIHGAIGTGKTYFAVALANYFVKTKESRVAFINFAKRSRELFELNRDFSKKEECERIINSLSNVPLLIIDSFGNEYVNDFVRDQVLMRLLNDRKEKKLVTVFVSEFSIADIKKLYTLKGESAYLRAQQIEQFLKREYQVFDLGSIPNLFSKSGN